MVLAEVIDRAQQGQQEQAFGIGGAEEHRERIGREQHHGIEHIALNTDTYTETLAQLKAKGVRVLEELPPGASGRRVCFLEAPDGAQVEVIEKV